MGYRSDVCMAIHAPKEWLLAEVATLRLTGNEARQQALDEMTLIDGGENFAILYLHDNCKWYSGYPDVAEIEAVWDHFVEALDEAEFPGAAKDDPRRNIDMAFVRVGDDDSDIETRYRGADPYDLVCLNRNIDVSFNLGAKDIRPRLNPAA